MTTPLKPKRVVANPDALYKPRSCQINKMSHSQSKVSESTLLVSEIFHSFQGEGKNIGVPSVFLRLAVCNLHCWYCDTKYSWLYNEKLLETVEYEMRKLGVFQPKPDLKVYDPKDEIHHLSITEAEEIISSYNCDHIVITGGEPLIQQISLASVLENIQASRNFFVEVETNGTIIPNDIMKKLVNQWNVSPKLESSGNSRYASEKSNCIETFKLLNTYFKFVIQDERDLEDAEKFVEKFEMPKERVLLMPEATEASVLEERGRTLSTYCEERGYSFSSRLHIAAYGNVRGK
jgi:7-carboxy-7-deazaguanine synthase